MRTLAASIGLLTLVGCQTGTSSQAVGPEDRFPNLENLQAYAFSDSVSFEGRSVRYASVPAKTGWFVIGIDGAVSNDVDEDRRVAATFSSRQLCPELFPGNAVTAVSAPAGPSTSVTPRDVDGVRYVGTVCLGLTLAPGVTVR